MTTDTIAAINIFKFRCSTRKIMLEEQQLSEQNYDSYIYPYGNGYYAGVINTINAEIESLNDTLKFLDAMLGEKESKLKESIVKAAEGFEEKENDQDKGIYK